MDVVQRNGADVSGLVHRSYSVPDPESTEVVMTVLDQLVDELRAVGGPIRSGDLANRICVSADSLDLPIDALHWQHVLMGSRTCSLTRHIGVV